jgi:predicted transcriptional regulator
MASNDLGQLQLSVMQVLWTKGKGSVRDVLNALDYEPTPAYTTVLTVLRNLEKRGLVAHQAVPGTRMFEYRSVVSAQDTCTERLHELLYHWYASSPMRLIVELIRIGDLSAEERAELRRMLDDLDADDENTALTAAPPDRNR